MNATKKASDDVIEQLIKPSEGLRLKAYPDPQSGGKPWTIGYGHTKGVKKGDICTKDMADTWLREDIKWAEDAVNQLAKVPLTQSQFDALVDFVFNIGRPRFALSTMLRKLNAKDYTGAAAEFARWTYRALPGTLIRRDKEKEWFLKDGLSGTCAT